MEEEESNRACNLGFSCLGMKWAQQGRGWGVKDFEKYRAWERVRI